MSTTFIPVRGKEDDILKKAVVDGVLSFATDSRKIYLDYGGKHMAMGGSGVAFHYGNAEPKTLDEYGYCYITADELESSENSPNKGDLILNKDGTFYKIEEISTIDGELTYSCTVLTVAGGGGGGTGIATFIKGSLNVTAVGETDIVNGDSCIFNIIAKSATEDGEPIDGADINNANMIVTVEYFEGTKISEGQKPYFTDEPFKMYHLQQKEYDAGPNLIDSGKTVIRFTITGSSSNKFKQDGIAERAVSTNELAISWVDSSFSNNDYYGIGKTAQLTPTVYFTTSGNRVCDIYFDEFLVLTEQLRDANKVQTSCTLTKDSKIFNPDGTVAGTLESAWTHGAHKITAQLSLLKSDNSRGSATELISREIAIKAEEKPLIWLDNYKSSYYEFDTVVIPYRVYDPSATTNVNVFLYKNGADILDGDSEEVPVTKTAFTDWTLPPLKQGENSYYTIRVGQGQNETRRDITFEVVEDPRHMGIVSTNLAVKLDTSGRTNTQKKRRSNLAVGTKKAIFSNFNWYNNGWIFDSKANATCLRISNGASLKLPIGAMTFSPTLEHTIELRMKIRNVQDYSPLITNYTRYKAVRESDNSTWSDDEKPNDSTPSIFQRFLDQRNAINGFTNYDAYLGKMLPIEIANFPDKFIPTYDELEYDSLYRDYNLNNAVIKFIETDANDVDSDISKVPAICFGPQDGFFSNGTNAVSVNFVEDKIINITIVYKGGQTSIGDDNLMKIYLNGMLTGVARSTKGDEAWTIGSLEKNIETYFKISSSSCDIDLYEFRIYNQALSLPEVLLNTAYDARDTKAWDLVNLYNQASDIQEDCAFSFKKMIDYNENAYKNHEELIMPYVIFTTDDTTSEVAGGNLPWFKTESDSTGVSHYERVDMEFVNTGLDEAFDRGNLAKIAADAGYTDTVKNGQVILTAIQDYYLHHCPSFIAKDIDLGVQGTSSEFYPRRNYKAKTKVKEKVFKEGTDVQETKVHYLGDNKNISYTEYKTKSAYHMRPHRGPFAESYKEDADANKMKFFYYDNNTVGTNKFTMKIDFMESSGSYNVGLANLVKNAYSHHPLRDYINYDAIVLKNGSEPEEYDKKAPYDASKTYYYKNHKGNIKSFSAIDSKTGLIESDCIRHYADLTEDKKSSITLAQYNEAFQKGSFYLAKLLGVTKVLGGTKNTLPSTMDDKDVLLANMVASESTLSDSDLASVNKIYITEGNITYDPANISGLSDYRTSVQGFPVLAFHQTKTREEAGKEPVFIGRYNMLLDKGADEAYGFKLGSKLLQGYVKDAKGAPKAVTDVAECWEFENNNRGWCSFRDPWNRRELSFAAPEGKTDAESYTSAGAPIVADSFEYRYHPDSDYIDLLTHLNNSVSNAEPRIKLYEAYGIDVGDTTNGKKLGREKLLDLYSNWEKACKWVWSTAVDATIVGPEGSLIPIPDLGVYGNENGEAGKPIWLGTKYEPNVYFIKDEKDVPKVAEGAFNPNETYYRYDEESKNYVTIRLTDDPNKVYVPNKYYYISNGNYILSDSPVIDEGIDYFKLAENYSPVNVKVNAETDPDYEEYVPGKYYTIARAGSAYAGENNKFAGQYILVTDPVESFNDTIEYFKSGIDDFWKLETPVSYGTTMYNFDTKEYRLAKFKNELQQHFNLEYLATYFIITEVLECYDSRGKNCMMASWGPQKDGGAYIWYPCFYDMDTQLGINNTGIPSFEYDIDATKDGSFSTNDSVLWNNFFTLFKDVASQKYQQLKGTAIAIFSGDETDAVGRLNHPPFSNVETIEKYYSCDPTLYNSYSMAGKRPLIALNLDEQYKYITITNDRGQTKGSNQYAVPPVTAGYVGSSLKGPLFKSDSSSTYFYALQGNRSMSRQQFLTNRLNYIDSWLNLGDYARAGENRIRSRISANNSTNTSDKWIEGEALNGQSLATKQPYYTVKVAPGTTYNGNTNYYIQKTDSTFGLELVEYDNPANWTEDINAGRVYREDKDEKNKTHLFDGEYWITMTPTRNMYVTVGTDAANFPSLKYSGTPVRFETADLKNGVKNSGNYREQLYYIYGLDQMKSLGDLSKLYFQEFYLEGNVSKLTDLKLGYDGLDESDQPYKNYNVNDWAIPGQATNTSVGMPLLREFNISNIRFKNNKYTLNLSSCEKLENFRCYGSNITQVTFADGVALNTLHLSETVGTLKLVEANLLTNIITSYKAPELNAEGNLVAQKGLYIPKLTDVVVNSTVSAENATAITTINLEGGNLGYDSYLLLQKFFTSCKNSNTNRYITMQKVQWSPWTLVEDDSLTEPEADKTYKVDNGHFGLREYNADTDIFKNLISNKMLYEYNEEIAATMPTIRDYSLLKDLADSQKYKAVGGAAVPNITGILYIQNLSNIDEGQIQGELQEKYPDLTIFFDKVTPGYAARFVMINDDGAEVLLGTDKIGKTEYESSVADGKPKFFMNPMDRGDDSKPNYEKGFVPSYINTLNATKDFLGWAYPTNTRANLVETYDELWTTIENGVNAPIHKWDTLAITPGTTDYTFYARFEEHYYTSTFHDGDGNTFSKKIVYGATVTAPDVSQFIPSKNDADAGAEFTYRFEGWARSENGAVQSLDKFVSNQDYDFYAVFSKVSVYENVMPEEYFNFSTFYESGAYANDIDGATWNVDKGFRISAKNANALKGKITIPTTHKHTDGKEYPVVAIDTGGFSNGSNITHIYFYKQNSIQDIKMRKFWDSAFNGCTKLQHIELPSSLRFIDSNAFTTCGNLRTFSSNPNLPKNQYEIAGNIYYIGESAFNQALALPSGQSAMTFHFGGSVKIIQSRALSNNDNTRITKVQFGGTGDPSQLSTVGTLVVRQNGGYEVDRIEFYSEDNEARKAFFNGLSISPYEDSNPNFQIKDMTMGGSYAVLNA